MSNALIRVLVFAVGGWLLATCLTPFYTTLAYKYKWWKRERKVDLLGKEMPVIAAIKAKKPMERRFPTMAGVIGVAAVAILTLLFNWTRSQTYLATLGLLMGGFVGLLDDIVNIWSAGRGTAGLNARAKLFMTIAVGVFLGWWFYAKMGWSSLFVPFVGSIEISWLIIPLFAFAVTSISNSVNITDGRDGLSGGLLAIAFAAFCVIALVEQRFGVAVFCGTMVGVLLSYLWFNVTPARFMMGDVGSFAFGTALAVVAMMTDAFLLVPIICLVFVLESGSVVLQTFSKMFCKKKLFRAAPLHWHLEATGWPESKVVMRFWVLAAVAALFGILLYVAGR
ncbi:MAG: phospho-N-acetylmuramoyl-pentapeptide-transferase [Candidatus Nomurabacteria bacterium]|jgi:phospho-N-acetylmuramoyl-pentapeptide-transferase|nr:phospho-N-acetylmuramoyl-pentapeptide-transferase [Candidatus Nomurabacteria bacterium]